MKQAIPTLFIATMGLTMVVDSHSGGVMPETVFSFGTKLSEDDKDLLKSDPSAATHAATVVLDKLNGQRFHDNETYTVISSLVFEQHTILASNYLTAKVQCTMAKDGTGAQPCVMGLIIDPEQMIGYWVPEKNLEEIIKSGTLAAVHGWESFNVPAKTYRLMFQ